MSKSCTGDYWGSISTKFSRGNNERLWRAHLQEVYRSLLDRWFEDSPAAYALKTDLFDEAISEHGLIPLCWKKCERTVGTEISLEVARTAKKNLNREGHSWKNAVCSNITLLAFKPGSFDYVVSNSTLDHFSHKKDISVSLGELRRILKPGGTLIITLDNPSNPVVFLRNNLPYRMLRFLRLIPYVMGETLSKSELAGALEKLGFKVLESTAIVHSPRILAIWAGHVLERFDNEKTNKLFFRLLKIIEALGTLPLKYLTGYFVAVRATKSHPCIVDPLLRRP